LGKVVGEHDGVMEGGGEERCVVRGGEKGSEEKERDGEGGESQNRGEGGGGEGSGKGVGGVGEGVRRGGKGECDEYVQSGKKKGQFWWVRLDHETGGVGKSELGVQMECATLGLSLTFKY